MAQLIRRWGIPFVVFLSSLILYVLSLEPTVSFWDCGEFIAAASGLQVSHPPGSPVHMLFGRLFVIVFGVDSAAVALNMMSAVAAAFTILLLYYTIRLVLKLILSEKRVDASKLMLIIEGASVIGALVFAVSDSFWYSAVEAEVYALSTLFTAILFYLGLTMYTELSPSDRGRRVYLVFFLLGISAGIHQLNLLVIPPVVLIIWLSNYRFSTLNVIKGLALGLGLFGGAYALIPYLLFFFARQFELLFVNSFDLFQWSGALFFGVLLLALFVFVIIYSKQRKRKRLEVWSTATMLFIVGLSVYLIVPIRSSQNVPLNTSRPDNVFSFWGYMQRDQYGSAPLLYGPYFNAPVKKIVPKDVHYRFANGRFEEAYRSGEVVYESGFSTLFPRMFSRSPEHAAAYASWASIPSGLLHDKDGTPIPPSFGQNVNFFLNYQVSHMYLRYFMWNFVGRQNDYPGHGDQFRGGWITGINFLDSKRVGDTRLLPSHFFENKGRNVYYLVPFILGFVGLIFVSLYSPRLVWPTVSLFILTGLAVAVFLNQAPYQARERDYAFLGSFYVFSLWIGLGCFYMLYTVSRYFSSKVWMWSLLAVLMLAAPVNMLSENWDDHDRSDRFIARNLAVDYLRSCAPNAILFTYGDNDTFPLWYIQEVEGFRTDVRVVNINFLGTSWGINQLRLKQHNSDPILFNGDEEFYEKNQTKTFSIERGSSPKCSLNRVIKNAFSLRTNDHSSDPLTLAVGYDVILLPAFETTDSSIIDAPQLKIEKPSLRTGELALLDIVASNAQSRPIYFASTVPNNLTLGLVALSSWEGNLMRSNPKGYNEAGKPNLSLAITNLVDSSHLAMSHAGYLDDANRRFVRIYLRLYAELADSLIKENRTDEAVRVLDKGREYFGDYCYEWNDIALDFISLYYMSGVRSTGSLLVERFTVRKFKELEYYKSLSPRSVKMARFDIERSTNALEEAISLQKEFDIRKKSKKLPN